MNTIDNVKIIELPQYSDDRGHLVVVEGGTAIPFNIKRLFYIYASAPAAIRGRHANKHSDFCMISLSGACKIKVVDCKGNEKVFNLDRPDTGIYIPAMIWKEMYDFFHDSVLLVLSNEYYDKNEYIINFDKFLKLGEES